MKNQVHYKTKNSRFNKIMSIQQKISREKMKEKVGNVEKVLTEDKSLDGKYYIGRTNVDVPEIDGVVFVKKEKNIKMNQFVDCKIIDFKEYDLIAEKI